MAHTTTNLLVHFIFSTRNRAPLINAEIEQDLHSYIGGIIREIGGVAMSINGMQEHVHLLMRVPATHSSRRRPCDQIELLPVGPRAMA